MVPGGEPVYFADENTLGLGKLLERSGRDDVLYPGHPALPEVPLGTDDLEWLPIVGAQKFVVLSRDRRIRSRPAELRLYWEHGLRSVWIGGKHDLGPRQQLELFNNYEARLARLIIKNGPGPWAVTMTPAGVRPLPIPPPW